MACFSQNVTALPSLEHREPVESRLPRLSLRDPENRRGLQDREDLAHQPGRRDQRDRPGQSVRVMPSWTPGCMWRPRSGPLRRLPALRAGGLRSRSGRSRASGLDLALAVVLAAGWVAARSSWSQPAVAVGRSQDFPAAAAGQRQDFLAAAAAHSQSFPAATALAHDWDRRMPLLSLPILGRTAASPLAIR